jgi:hypothetical protein
MCVSLGANGNFYVRTTTGWYSFLSLDIIDRVGPINKVKALWLGKDNAYCFVRLDGTKGWALKDQYPELNEGLQESKEAPVVSSKSTYITEYKCNVTY